MKVRVEDIKVSDRFREDFGDISDLAQSIEKYGLLHPIVIDKNLNLIAGERRLRAHRELKLEEIPVTFYEEVSELVAKEIELEENIRRKNFTWQEEVNAKRELDRIKKEIYGTGTAGRGKDGWSLRDTARELHQSVGSVSMDIQLAEGLERFPELLKEKSKTVAYNKLKILLERELRKELAKKIDFGRASEAHNIVQLADCIEYMQEMEDESVDLIWTDPPWGVNINETQAGKGSTEGYYEDSEEAMKSLMRKVYPHFYRILKPGTHLYVVFGIQYMEFHKSELEKAGFQVDPFPLIGDKKASGVMTSPLRYSNSYSPILFCWKLPTRELNKGGGQKNVFDMPRVHSDKRYHPAENPIEIIQNHIENSTEPGDLVFEPFVGGGSTLEAALRSNRRALGTEKDPVHYTNALERIANYLGGVTI